MGRVWLGRYEGFDSEVAACYSDGKVWLGRYEGFDSKVAACYSDGKVWLGRYEGFDSEVAACYSDGKVWLGRYEGFDSEVAACYSDGKVWLGRYEGFDSEVAARYDGSDEGAAAAAFVLLFLDGDREYEESSSSDEETSYESSDSSSDNRYSSPYSSLGGSSASSSSGSFWIWLIVLAVGLPIGAFFNQLNHDRQTQSLNTPSVTQAPPPPPKYITGVGADGTQYYSDGTTSAGGSGLQGTISETAAAPQIRPEEVIAEQSAREQQAQEQQEAQQREQEESQLSSRLQNCVNAPEFKQAWVQYTQLPGVKALAIVVTSDGRCSAGWANGTAPGALQSEANSRAISSCRDTSARSEIYESCRVYAEGNNIVWR